MPAGSASITVALVRLSYLDCTGTVNTEHYVSHDRLARAIDDNVLRLQADSLLGATLWIIQLPIRLWYYVSERHRSDTPEQCC